MHHQKCSIDRRAVRVRLTEKGRSVRDIVGALFERHVGWIEEKNPLGDADLAGINNSLRRLERFWTDQIRYIY